MEVEWVRDAKLWLALACVVWCCVEPYLQVPTEVKGFKPYHVVSCLPFFVVGMMIKEKKLDVMRGSFEIKLASFFIFFVITLLNGRPDLAGYMYGTSYGMFFLNALLGSWLLFNLCRLAPIGRYWLTSLATGTLLILGVHGWMYPIILSIFHHLGWHHPYSPLLTGLLVLAICFPVIRYLESRCPLLLGKS